MSDGESGHPKIPFCGAGPAGGDGVAPGDDCPGLVSAAAAAVPTAADDPGIEDLVEESTPFHNCRGSKE